MLPVQGQKQPEKKPWHKQWWAAPALGAGALGAGYLTDKLVNGGQLTSSLLNSTKPAEAPNPVSSLINHVSDYADKVDYKTPTKPLIAEGVDGPVAVAGGIAGLGALGGQALEWGGKTLGKVPGLENIPKFVGTMPTWGSKLLGGASTVAAPVMDYHLGSDPIFGDAQADMWNKIPSVNISNETGAKISGGMGLGMGLLTTLNPMVGIPASVALGGIHTVLNRWQDKINMDDKNSEYGASMFKTLLNAVKAGDVNTIQQVKQLDPELANHTYFQNLPRAKQMIQDMYSRL